MGRGRAGWVRRQEGSQALELVALLPLLLTTALLLWQFALTGHTLIVAESAVRDAARGGGGGGGAPPPPPPPPRLSAGDLPVTVDDPVYEPGTAGCQTTVQLRVAVPLVALPFLRGQALSIVRQATMPAAPEFCP